MDADFVRVLSPGGTVLVLVLEKVVLAAAGRAPMLGRGPKGKKDRSASLAARYAGGASLCRQR